MEKDEDAFTCDMAEYYHIYDWKHFPMRYVATLAAGLRPSSRSYMLACGVKANLSDSLQAMQYDALQDIRALLVGKKQVKKIKHVSEKVIFGNKKKKGEEYEKVADFDSEWKKRVESIKRKGGK